MEISSFEVVEISYIYNTLKGRSRVIVSLYSAESREQIYILFYEKYKEIVNPMKRMRRSVRSAQ